MIHPYRTIPVYVFPPPAGSILGDEKFASAGKTVLYKVQKFISLGARKSSPVKVPRAEVLQSRHSAEKSERKKKNSRNDGVQVECPSVTDRVVALPARVKMLSDVADVSVSQRRTAASSRIDTGQAIDLQLGHD